MRVVIPTESEEQQALFRWAQLQAGKYPELRWMYHIPNEGLRHPATGRRLRSEGLKRGVPDICLPTARGGYHGLYIELKRTRGGAVSPAQAEWLAALRDAGYAAGVCRGWEEARNWIVQYLEVDKREGVYGLRPGAAQGDCSDDEVAKRQAPR